MLSQREEVQRIWLWDGVWNNDFNLDSYLLSRDAYTCIKIIQLKELQEEKSAIEEKERKTKKDQLRLRKIEEEMKPLEQFLAEAKLQRAAIKAEIGTVIECDCFLLI